MFVLRLNMMLTNVQMLLFFLFSVRKQNSTLSHTWSSTCQRDCTMPTIDALKTFICWWRGSGTLPGISATGSAHQNLARVQFYKPAPAKLGTRADPLPALFSNEICTQPIYVISVRPVTYIRPVIVPETVAWLNTYTSFSWWFKCCAG